jgi:hypothetical protein
MVGVSLGVVMGIGATGGLGLWGDEDRVGIYFRGPATLAVGSEVGASIEAAYGPEAVAKGKSAEYCVAVEFGGCRSSNASGHMVTGTIGDDLGVHAGETYTGGFGRALVDRDAILSALGTFANNLTAAYQTFVSGGAQFWNGYVSSTAPWNK